jgi:hypothetical protein
MAVRYISDQPRTGGQNLTDFYSYAKFIEVGNALPLLTMRPFSDNYHLYHYIGKTLSQDMISVPVYWSAKQIQTTKPQ